MKVLGAAGGEEALPPSVEDGDENPGCAVYQRERNLERLTGRRWDVFVGDAADVEGFPAEHGVLTAGLREPTTDRRFST